MPFVDLRYLGVNQSPPSGRDLVFLIESSIGNTAVPCSQSRSQSKVIRNTLIAYVFMALITLMFLVLNKLYILCGKRSKKGLSYKQGFCATPPEAITVCSPNPAGLGMIGNREHSPQIRTKASAIPTHLWGQFFDEI